MTHIQTRLGARALRVAVLAALAALAIALVPATADAHVLPAKKAKKLRNQTAVALANALDGQGIESNGVAGVLDVENALVGRCRRSGNRRHTHKRTCLIGANGVAHFEDGFSERFQCDADFVAKFRSRRSRKIRTSVSNLGCGPEPTAASARFARRAKRAYSLRR